MLTHDDPTITVDPSAPKLRQVLLANASTSGAGGLAALAFGGPVADLLGVDRTVWVRVVGAGLLAFAAFVVWVATSPPMRVKKETPAITAGDAGWVVGTLVTIALGWYSTRGALAMAAVGAMVGTFAVAQAVLVRRLPSGR